MMRAFKILTYSIGLIGLSANTLLTCAIRKSTPTALCDYAIIFLAATICDTICLISMLITTTKEVVFSGSCMMEFHGVCTLFSDETCWTFFGIQGQMYCTTSSIICTAFFYRLQLIGDTKFAQRKYLIMLILISSIIHAHEAPGLYHSMANGSRETAFIGGYGLLFVQDLYSVCVTAYIVLMAILCFIITIILRESLSPASKVQHKMLSDALNLQLASSSLFFVGVMMFNVNLIFEGTSPELAQYIVLVVNLENSPLTTLYVITPYRRYITRLLPGRQTEVKATPASFSVISQVQAANASIAP